MSIQEFNLTEIKKTLNCKYSEIAKIGVFGSGRLEGIWEGSGQIFNPDDLF